MIEYMYELWHETGEKPEGLVLMPQIEPENAEVYKAFSDLSGMRVHGEGGPPPLSTTEIQAYLRDVMFIQDANRRNDYFEIIRRVDQTYRIQAHKRMKKAMDKPPPK